MNCLRPWQGDNQLAIVALFRCDGNVTRAISDCLLLKVDTMNTRTTRRELFRAGTQGAIAAAVVAGFTNVLAGTEPPPNTADAANMWLGYPRQDQKIVGEIVGVSHFDGQRVKQIVEAYPEVVNAWWDWGFGDWESPLGAASHTGQREIAEYLLAQGARIDIFAAAMLGFTNVVQALVAAQPGIQRTRGPHGIPLLAHAKAGGDDAADTVAYLESLGDAGIGLQVTTLAAEARTKYLGQFASTEHDLKLACRLNKAGLLVVDVHYGDSQSNNRIIQFTGDDKFFPSGVPSVHIQFAFENDIASSVTISGSVPEVSLQRTDG
jgi:hypothetical protein